MINIRKTIFLVCNMKRVTNFSKMSKRKAPDNTDNLNQDMTDFLIELSNYEKNTNRNIFKYNAYRKAASILSTHHKRIESGVEAKKLNGVGDKIAKKIDEFLQTGKLEKLEKIRKDDTSMIINLFTRVSGIGPAKARELAELGIKSLEELRKHKDKLNHHQLIGLRYVEDFEKKIPRKEIEEIEKILRNCIYELDQNYSVTICGSYRRGKAESGDIDVLITHPSYTSSCTNKSLRTNLLKSVITTLEKNGLITETIALGDTKFMGACKTGEVTRRIDIRLTPNDLYYCTVLHFTGSDMFNKEMRAHALEMKFTLNEYCLRPIGTTGRPGEPVPITCEKDVFEYINFPYKEPHERNM